MRSVVDRYFAAMRRGAEAQEEMMSLFADDAVYIEPFIDPEVPAQGRDEIRERLSVGWESPLPDMELYVLEVETGADGARSLWECRSPALPSPVRGEDIYQISDGVITRLEVRILD